MSKRQVYYGSRRGSSETNPHLSGPVAAQRVVRRFGFVGAKVHQALMEALLRGGHDELAEAFNDQFKPLVDGLIHFTLVEEPDVSEEV